MYNNDCIPVFTNCVFLANVADPALEVGAGGSGKALRRALKEGDSIPCVRDEIRAFFEDAVPPCATECAHTADKDKMDCFQSIEKNHGRIEKRHYWQSTDIEWFVDKALWKNLRSFGMVESIRTLKGKSTIERRY